MKPIGYIITPTATKPTNGEHPVINQNSHEPGDRLVRHERRGLWLCLLVIVLLGVVALLAGMSSDPAKMRYAERLMTLIPLVIIFGAIWVNRLQQGAKPAELKEQQRAMLNDELRLVASQHAFRAGFLSMLGAQALFCLLSFVVTLSWSAGLLAATTVTLGTAVFIGVFLFYDRA
jgi:lysylphosphatidylglycerol synthetase-like protein (DUF2156 family)